jgi:hypothetical protein
MSAKHVKFGASTPRRVPFLGDLGSLESIWDSLDVSGCQEDANMPEFSAILVPNGADSAAKRREEVL